MKLEVAVIVKYLLLWLDVCGSTDMVINDHISYQY